MRHAATIVLCLFLASVSTVAAEPITIGETVKIQSKILGEERTVLISTPTNYARSMDRYPVLYMTDGDAHLTHTRGTVDFLVLNDLMPDLIIVGIANTDRDRDLSPTHWVRTPGDGTPEAQNTSGGAPKFLDFFAQELFPYVESHYRTAPYRIFAGHSRGGLLALYTMAARPELFNAIIAASPSLDWDDDYPLRTVEAFFKDRKEFQRTVFVTMANEEDGDPKPTRFERLCTTLGGVKADGFTWGSMLMPDETHGTVVLRSHYWGLRKTFDGWKLPADPQTRRFTGTLADIKEHYAGLAKRLGMTIPAPEQTVNQFGYQLLQQGRVEEAIAAFRYNVELYPDSANAYDSLGEALERSGRPGAALENYTKAVERAKKAKDNHLETFTRNRDRLTFGSEIHDAAATGDLAKVKALVAKDPALVDAKGEAGLAEDETPLLLAIYGGHVQTAEYLVAEGADVNARNGMGSAPLSAALSRRLPLEFVRLLVEKGADVNYTRRHGEAPLDIAAGDDGPAVAAYLKSKGALPTAGGAEVVNLPGGLRRVAFGWGMRNNVVVFAGSDGVLLVDSGFSRRSAEDLKKLVEGWSTVGVRYVVNTHNHGDHRAGNGLAGPAGEVIDLESLPGARLDKVLDKTSLTLKGEGGRSFTAPYTLRLNGEEVRFIPNPGLHSETDMLVYFQKAGVLCMGDLLLSQNFPAVQDVAGYLAFLDNVLDVFPQTTVFVGGHGRDLDRAGLKKYRDMLQEAAEVVRSEKAKGVTAGQMIQAHVLKAYEAEYSYLEWLGPQAWIRSVCRER